MSSPISTPRARASDARPYEGEVWRLVEAQHRISTLKLVDTPEEQKILEDLIDGTKPPLPPEALGLHYLLATPFRYAPYPHGSRFRAAGATPGVFYASEEVETAIAEMAFYRYLFFAAAPETALPRNATEYTAFSVRIGTARMLDLTAKPLSGAKAVWTHPTNYEPCQAFAASARTLGAELLRYQSVRDPMARANVAVLTCRAFASKRPVRLQSWRLRIGRNGASAICEAPARSLGISAKDFPPDPRLEAYWNRPG
jgi:hypothetical protein